MLDPIGNQIIHNKRRKARKTERTFKMRLDRHSIEALEYIMDQLSGTTPADVVTTAMATRRALKVYAVMVEQYQADPNFMTREMLGVRVNSAIPATVRQTPQQAQEDRS